jgi:hypothetical protein
MARPIKSHGLSYLRHAVNHRNKKLNYISLPVDKAEEILEVAGSFQPNQNQYTSRSNSVKGAAVVLAMDLKELIERLNCPTPSKILNDLAEAKCRLKAMSEAGDVLARTASKEAIKEWVRAKSL